MFSHSAMLSGALPFVAFSAERKMWSFIWVPSALSRDPSVACSVWWHSFAYTLLYVGSVLLSRLPWCDVLCQGMVVVCETYQTPDVFAVLSKLRNVDITHAHACTDSTEWNGGN